MTAANTNEASASKKPVKKTNALVARKRVRRAPAYSRGGRRNAISGKTTAIVAKPKEARAKGYSEERRLANQMMLQQREGGMSITAIARLHKTSVNAVYQRLWRARIDTKGNTSASASVVQGHEVSSVISDMAYFRGRVDQLEALFVKAINLGVERFVRTVNA